MKQWLVTMFLFSFFYNVAAREFSEGQVWSYKTRKGEEESTVLINKIELDSKKRKLFHISISGLKIKNPKSAKGITTELPHLPVTEETLSPSLIKLLNKSLPNPAYLEGYNTWKVAFDKGEAGVWTGSVADIVGIIEVGINKS